MEEMPPNAQNNKEERQKIQKRIEKSSKILDWLEKDNINSQKNMYSDIKSNLDKLERMSKVELTADNAVLDLSLQIRGMPKIMTIDPNRGPEFSQIYANLDHLNNIFHEEVAVLDEVSKSIHTHSKRLDKSSSRHTTTKTLLKKYRKKKHQLTKKIKNRNVAEQPPVVPAAQEPRVEDPGNNRPIVPEGSQAVGNSSAGANNGPKRGPRRRRQRRHSWSHPYNQGAGTVRNVPNLRSGANARANTAARGISQPSSAVQEKPPN